MEDPEKPSAKTIQVPNDMGRIARHQCPRTKTFPENGEPFDYRVHMASSRRGGTEANPGEDL
jgi:hypothetical protein